LGCTTNRMALGSLDSRNTFCGSVQVTNPQKVSEAFTG
jgi:hypothetical protein